METYIVELKSVIQNAADAEGFPVRFIPIKNALDLYGDETEDVCPPLFIGNPPVSRWNSEERANDITPLYSKMLDGEAKDLEETFQHIDEVMIDSLFDYFIDYELGNSDMPDDFIMESLQMDAMNGYEDAISSHLAVIVDR